MSADRFVESSDSVKSLQHRITEDDDHEMWRDVRGYRTLWEVFSDHAESTPDAIAIEDPCDRKAFTVGEPEKLSFTQAKAKAEKLAAAFLSRGMKKGDVVVVQLPNIHELAIACLASALSGVIVSTIKMQFKAHSLKMYLSKTKAVAFIGCVNYEAGMGPAIKPITSGSGLIPVLRELEIGSVFCLGETDAESLAALGDAFVDLGKVFDADLDASALKDLDEVGVNDVYNCAWSSGTTGEAKGILHTHGEVVAFARNYFDMYEISPDDTYKATLHVAPGDSWLILGTWVVYGGTLLYCDLRPSEVGWNAFFPGLARTTWFIAIPGIYDVILTYMKEPLKHMDLSKVKNWGTVSAAMPAKVATALKREFDIDVLNLYACNEGSTLYNTAKMLPDAAKRCTHFPALGFPGSKWPNPRGIKTKIIDRVDGTPLTAPGSIGFLTIKTAATCAKFVCNLDDKVNWPFDYEGYLNANDVMRVVAGEDGSPKWFEMMGRDRDILRIMGMDYPPTLIESVFADNEKVKDVAATALPCNANSEKGKSGGDLEVWIVIVARDSKADGLAAPEAKAWAEKDGRLPWTVWPAGVVVVDRLPVNKAFKLDRAKVKEIAAEAQNKLLQ